MSSELANELERLYRDYFDGRIEFPEYRRRRAPLLDSLLDPEGLAIAEQTQPRRSDTITQVEQPAATLPSAPPKSRRGFHWAAVLAGCAIVVVAVFYFVSRQIDVPQTARPVAQSETAPPAMTLDEQNALIAAEPAEATRTPPDVGQSLIEDFLARQDWRQLSLLEFQESWGRFPASDRIVAKGAVWFEPLAADLEQRIEEAWAVAIDPDNDEQLDQLYEFSLHLGLVELVPAGWTPDPKKVNRGVERAAPRPARVAEEPPAARVEAAADNVEKPVAAAATNPPAGESSIAASASTAKPSAAQAQNKNACDRAQLQTRRRNCFDIIGTGIDGPLMRVLQAGEFVMGGDASADEQPVRSESVAEPFAMSVYEITWAEFRLYCEQTGTACPERRWPGDDMPVVDVSWHQASAYTAWLGDKTGQTYRLPTEVEWEYAARAGTTTAYPYGDKLLPAQARYSSITEYDSPLPQSDKTTQRNDFGLWHVVGNVREWVATDWQGGAAGSMKVVRGGSYAADENALRSSSRQPLAADAGDARTGFRIVREL